jgi:hypothetical protein
MGDLSLFIPITKVDATQHLVYGVATAELEDRAGEICDYWSTKPHYERWSDEIAQSTSGKSLGNLRAMHGPVAAGKVTAITFNDDARQIEICAKVVDESEWIKVTEGVYTGFSQGGTYERRWTDESGLTRYTAIPSEISLVDLPCLAQARFEMIKVDGTRELRRFESRPSVVARRDELVQHLDWLESLTKDELSEVPDLDELQARLEAAWRRIEAGVGGSRRRQPASSSRFAGTPDRAGKAVSNSRVVDDDLELRDFEQHRACHHPGHGSEAEEYALPAPAKSMQWHAEKRFDALAAMLTDVLQRVKNIELQPLPLPLSGGRRVVAKHEDGAREHNPDTVIDSLLSEPEALSILAIRLAQRNGRATIR